MFEKQKEAGDGPLKIIQFKFARVSERNDFFFSCRLCLKIDRKGKDNLQFARNQCDQKKIAKCL